MVKLEQNPDYSARSPVVIWRSRPVAKSAYYYYTLYALAISQDRQIDQNTSGRFTLKTNLALSFIDSYLI